MLLLGIVTAKQERPLHAERGAMGGEWGGGCQLLESCPNAAVVKPLIREHTKREPPVLFCSAGCRNTAARDLRHGVLPSRNNNAPVGIDGNSMKNTAASEEGVLTVPSEVILRSRLLWLSAMMMLPSSSTATPQGPLNCAAGTVHHTFTSGPRELPHGAVGGDVEHAIVAVVRYDDAALAIQVNPFFFTTHQSW
jgi:hypothetical protein